MTISYYLCRIRSRPPDLGGRGRIQLYNNVCKLPCCLIAYDVEKAAKTACVPCAEENENINSDLTDLKYSNAPSKNQR